MANFEVAFNLTMGAEGNYSNDAEDSGVKHTRELQETWMLIGQVGRLWIH
jgi:hypothetical protein